MNIIHFDTNTRKHLQVEELSTQLATKTGTIWLDIAEPNDEAARLLDKVFHFHPLAIEDTRNQQQRPKIEEYDDYLFIILNPVQIDRETVELPAEGRKKREAPFVRLDVGFRELDIFVGSHFIVTVHRGADHVIEEAQRRCNRHGASVSSGYLLYVLLDVVVDSYFPVLDIITEEIDELENIILASARPQTLNRLFGLKRRLNEVWRVASQQRDMFNVLTRRDMAYIDYERLQYHLRDVYDHLLRITDLAGASRDLLTSMVDLYMSAFSNRLNQVVNRLTVVTIGIGAMAVITGFYGMNFNHTWPPFDAPWGVPFVLLLIGAVMAIVLGIFRFMRR